MSFDTESTSSMIDENSSLLSYDDEEYTNDKGDSFDSSDTDSDSFDGSLKDDFDLFTSLAVSESEYAEKISKPFVKKESRPVDEGEGIEPLDEATINAVLAGIPPIKSAFQDHSESATKELKALFRSSLSETQIPVNQRQSFIRYMSRKFEAAKIPQGVPVGGRTAETVNQTNMQMTLNVFHDSGGNASILHGFKAMEALLDGSTSGKSTYMQISFKNKYLNYVDIMKNIYPKLVHVSVKDVVLEMEYRINGDVEEPKWWGFYKNAFIDFPVDHKVSLRMKIDTSLLMKHRLLLRDVASAIKSNVDEGKIMILCSPGSQGIIDMIRISTQVEDESNAYLKELQGLQGDIDDKLNSMTIRGIQKITSAEPKFILFRNIIQHEMETNEYTDSSTEKYGWIIVLNRLLLQELGIPLSRVINWYKAYGLEAKRFNPYHTEEKTEKVDILEYSLLVKTNTNQKPSKVISDLSATAEKVVEEEVQKYLRTENKGRRDRNTLLSKYHDNDRFWYIQTTGSNYAQILRLREIDSLHTYSSDIYETFDFLGIEALRTLVHRRFIDLLKVGAKKFINPRFSMLLVEWLTTKGKFRKMTSHVSATTMQPLVAAASRNAANTLSMAAARGDTHRSTDPSAALMLGASPRGIGRGKALTPVEFKERMSRGGMKNLDAKDMMTYLENSKILGRTNLAASGASYQPTQDASLIPTELGIQKMFGKNSPDKHVRIVEFPPNTTDTVRSSFDGVKSLSKMMTRSSPVRNMTHKGRVRGRAALRISDVYTERKQIGANALGVATDNFLYPEPTRREMNTEYISKMIKYGSRIKEKKEEVKLTASQKLIQEGLNQMEFKLL